MNTKCTLKQGDGFHLYSEYFEPDLVYLEISKDVDHFKFIARKSVFSIAIPRKIWEAIRDAEFPDGGGLLDTRDE